jgi:hypothetical protein
MVAAEWNADSQSEFSALTDCLVRDGVRETQEDLLILMRYQRYPDFT